MVSKETFEKAVKTGNVTLVKLLTDTLKNHRTLLDEETGGTHLEGKVKEWLLTPIAQTALIEREKTDSKLCQVGIFLQKLKAKGTFLTNFITYACHNTILKNSRRR